MAGAPKTSLTAPDIRPGRPVHAAAPECHRCVWTPLPGGVWSLKSLNRACGRHMRAEPAPPPAALPDPGGPARLPRCPVNACPIRWRAGPDRLCSMHLVDEVTANASQRVLASIALGRERQSGDPAELPDAPDDPAGVEQ